MNLYLAESGGLWGAYFRTKSKGGEGDENLLRLAPSQEIGSGIDGEIFRGANILQSFYYADAFTENVILPNCKRFLLDSGAFTFFGKGNDVDWNEYIRKYAAFINRNKIEHFFELDIDALIGFDKVLYYRAVLEDMTGKPCIPVWHRERGTDEFINMCEKYKYVAVGGVAKNPNGQRVTQAFPWFIKTAHEHGTKIHGLGYTSLTGLEKHKFDSVDSTAWTSGNRFGTVYRFNGRTVQTLKKQAGQRIADHGALARHNFTEWKKFAQYAEIKL